MTPAERKRALDNAASRRRPTRPEYNRRDYRRAAKKLLAGHPRCVKCGAPATTANHKRMISKGGTLKGGLNAMCLKCASAQGGAAS